ncbi:MFS transporter [Chelatococcus asaccharovorans]|uniref:MFS transporter n=1 Tax=Chelatococcus asaccharovorans TaxID=28210 RepID=UPI0014745644|nr:MFS transporter [Chelatococcus asaccharovorans]
MGVHQGGAPAHGAAGQLGPRAAIAHPFEIARPRHARIPAGRTKAGAPLPRPLGPTARVVPPAAAMMHRPAASGGPRLLPLLSIPFCVMTGTGMMFPLLAVMAERDGSGQAGAGILLTSFAAARLASNMPAGVAADRYGRTVVMRAGLLILALGSFGAYWALGLLASALCILLLGAGSSIALTAALAALTDRSAAGTRGLMMSRYQTAVLIGISLGPVTGGLLSTRFGVASPFLLQGVMASLALALALAYAADRPQVQAPPHAAPAPGRSGSVLTQFLSLGFAVLGVLTFTLYMTRTATSWQIVPIIARDAFGMSFETVGLLLTAGALANLVIQPFIGPFIDRLGAAPSILLGSVTVTVAFVLISIESDVRFLWAGVVLSGAASGILAPSLNSFAVDLSKGGYGATLGALRTAGDAGLVLGPLVLGPMLALFGLSHQVGLIASAVTMAASTLLFIAVHGGRLGRPG